MGVTFSRICIDFTCKTNCLDLQQLLVSTYGIRTKTVRVEHNYYMRAPETTVVIPNGSHYRDSQYYTKISGYTL